MFNTKGTSDIWRLSPCLTIGSTAGMTAASKPVIVPTIVNNATWKKYVNAVKTRKIPK